MFLTTQRLRTCGDPAEAAVRIVALGDCNTITRDPRQGTVADGLWDALRDRGIAVRLTNLGCGMTTTREGLCLVQDHDEPADLTIVNYGLVDSWMTTIPQMYVPYYPDNPFRKRVRKLLKFVKNRLRSRLVRKLVPMGPVVSQDEYLRNMQEMLRLLRQRNPDNAVYFWGTVPVDGDPERHLAIVEYNAILEQIAEDESATYVDTTEVLAHQPPTERFLDGVHLSPAAARLIGQRISDLFLQSRQRPIRLRDAA